MKYGITFGAFDLLHAGHVLFFESCKEHCDHLIVGLHIDPSIQNSKKNKPIESLIERTIKLNGCRFVDKVLPYETEEDIDFMLKCPAGADLQYYFVGSDHENDFITGQDEFKGKILLIPRNHGYSSSDLRARVLDRWSAKHDPFHPEYNNYNGRPSHAL
jgi:glycerol-3-phosphate cytidylyltransferase